MAAHKIKSAQARETGLKKSTNTSREVPSHASSTFFSSNPDKAWVEKFFLLYTPIWMSSMAYMMFSGAVSRWSDTAMLYHGILTGTPAFIIPMIIAPKFSQRPWHESYWFKANLYLFIFGFFGNYFGTEYFFDMLGMTYRFPLVTTTLDSALVGKGEQTVPVIMYFYTHVYFMTYHVTANIALRLIMRLRLSAGRWIVFGAATFVIGYVWAWLETKAMANPLMETQFYYEKMDVMLRFGSAIYATYFVASFPIWYFIDEKVEDCWTVLQTASAAMSASMITFYLLDFSAQWVGTL
jgi:cycloeucalenol cycloisomerase